ncbi:MAG: HAD family phosphatase [Pseudomonadota bacterium]
MEQPEVILFDLGGVLVELGPEPLPSCCLPEGQMFRLENWFSSEIAIAFEKGMATPEEFAESLQRDLNLNASAKEIIRHFTNWPKGVFPGVHQLLGTLQNRYRLALLTNTNELHWPRITDEFKILHWFEHSFASHQLNMVKPDADLYQHVIRTLNLLPHEILFLDDNFKNVLAAEKAGMRAIQVNGPEELRVALQAYTD